MNGKTMSSFVEETLDSLMGSNFSRNVKITVEQLNENMADLARRNKLKRVPLIGKALPGATVDLTEAGGILRKNGVGGSDSSMFGSFNDMLEKEYLKYANRAGATATAADISSANIADKLGVVNYLANVPSAYLNVADKHVKDHRIGAMVGGYAAAAVGVRVMQGGSITHNQYGQKDIAGIPFV